MSCPVCGHRKGRRSCPALGSTICSACCGTKRLVEIDCPSDCPHLAAAREHPAAVVRRQQERDVGALLPAIRQLTERQHQLFFLFHTVISRHVPEGLSRLTDDDVADAATAVATTLETAARGIIYEEAPHSLPAQRLAREMTIMLAEMRREGATVYDGEAAITLRAIADGARETRTRAAGGEVAYLALMSRLLQDNRGPRPGDAIETRNAESSIILP